MDKEMYKHWKCTTCGGTYHSPIKVAAVACGVCSRKTGRVAKWMKPDE